MLILDKSVDKKLHAEVLAYVSQSKTARTILDFHKKSPVKLFIGQLSTTGKASFANEYGVQNNIHSIYYHPYAGYEGPTGILSPALAHIHELAHAYLHIAKKPIALLNDHVKEENYVVQNFENKISRELKEPVRLVYRSFHKVLVDKPIPPCKVTKRWR
ncbi:MAG: hypothetical protein QM500_05635 [Methylococcales bacterium]